MDWLAQVDNYCERTGPGFWAEPVNAISNLSFILAALFVWALLGGKRDRAARVLVLILVAIGIGSFIFHTIATRWAGLADVIPITTFILVFLYFAVRRFLELPLWAGLASVGLFFPYSYVAEAAVQNSFGPLNGSANYVPVAILIGLFGLAMLPRERDTGRNLLIGAGLLAVSLVFRTIDNGVCTGFPLGTHFVWHILNGVMLGWMIMTLHHHTPMPGHATGPRY